MIEIIDEFDLVYESGHTSTYCSGDKHVVLNGGWAGNWKPDLWRGQFNLRPCSCDFWKKENERIL